MKTYMNLLAGLLMMGVYSCGSSNGNEQQSADTMVALAQTQDPQNEGTKPQPPYLPEPYATESAKNYCEVIGWPDGVTPKAPNGFAVSKYAGDLKNPRWIYVGPNGDVFVCEAMGKVGPVKAVKAIVSGAAKSANEKMQGSANRITMFRDTNGDGMPDERHEFLKDLYHPLGMAIIGNKFYVANIDAVVYYPYQAGQTEITAKATKVTELPEGQGHWTRNIVASADGSKLYVAVGSASNVAEGGMEKEEGRAMIWVMNADGSAKRAFATGLRNPCGMAWGADGKLWTVVNERDALGDDLVPDYLTSVKDGGFYGWPYSYWGQHADPRMKDKQRPDLVSKAIVPEVSMGAHTAALGLAFDDGNMPGRYKGGAFAGQHGSWNRAVLAGYAVVFVPFKGGQPTGSQEPFLTGFIADSAKSEVYGRPVGVAFSKRGDMLVADDAGNTVWRVAKK